MITDHWLPFLPKTTDIIMLICWHQRNPNAEASDAVQELGDAYLSPANSGNNSRGIRYISRTAEVLFYLVEFQLFITTAVY